MVSSSSNDDNIKGKCFVFYDFDDTNLRKSINRAGGSVSRKMIVDAWAIIVSDGRRLRKARAEALAIGSFASVHTRESFRNMLLRSAGIRNVSEFMVYEPLAKAIEEGIKTYRTMHRRRSDAYPELESSEVARRLGVYKNVFLRKAIETYRSRRSEPYDVKETKYQLPPIEYPRNRNLLNLPALNPRLKLNSPQRCAQARLRLQELEKQEKYLESARNAASAAADDIDTTVMMNDIMNGSKTRKAVTPAITPF